MAISTIGTNGIEDGAIVAADIAAGAVTQTKVATGVAGTGPAFSAYNSAGSQSVSNATFTKVTLNNETFDTANAFDKDTNYRFQPLVAGYYQINATLGFGTSSIINAIIELYKNGASIKRAAQISFPSGGMNEVHLVISTIVYMNGTTDYLELYGYVNGTTPLFYGGSANTFFEGFLARAA